MAKKMRNRCNKPVCLIVITLILLAMLSLNVGFAKISLWVALEQFLQFELKAESIILLEIRLPRTLMCLIVGSGLGLVGASLQGYLRNPLAEPSIIGISSAAALGAVFAIFIGLREHGTVFTPLFALAGASCAGFILSKFSNFGESRNTVILIGIGLSSIAGAFTSLILSFSENPFAINEIVFWMLGSLTDVSFDHVLLSVVPVITGALLLIRCYDDLNLLSLGEETAATAGVNIKKLKNKIVIGSSLIVGGVTAVVGVIGFVGLITPHIVRPFVNNEPGKTLLLSCPIGALIVLMSDIVIRTLPTSGEMKLGVLTALIGTPFFLYLIFRQKV